MLVSNKTENWLAGWGDFRTANLLEVVKYPDLTIQLTERLLATA